MRGAGGSGGVGGVHSNAGEIHFSAAEILVTVF